MKKVCSYGIYPQVVGVSKNDSWNELVWDFWFPCGIVFIIYILRYFENAKICHYKPDETTKETRRISTNA